MRPLFQLINQTIQSLSDKKAVKKERLGDMIPLIAYSQLIMAGHSTHSFLQTPAYFSLFTLPHPAMIKIGPLKPEIESMKNEYGMTRDAAVKIQEIINQLDQHPQSNDKPLNTLTTKAFHLIVPALQNTKHFTEADRLYYDSEKHCWKISDSLLEKLNEEKDVLNILKSIGLDI